MSKNNSWQKYEIYLTFSKRLHLLSLMAKRGRKSFFTPEGKMALAFLKMHTGLRTKYKDIEKANLAYRKQRKHTHKQTRKMIMRLLALLGKII